MKTPKTVATLLSISLCLGACSSHVSESDLAGHSFQEVNPAAPDEKITFTFNKDNTGCINDCVDGPPLSWELKDDSLHLQMLVAPNNMSNIFREGGKIDMNEAMKGLAQLPTFDFYVKRDGADLIVTDESSEKRWKAQ